MKIQWHNSWSM